jgi:hypothetical protein
MLSHVHIPRVRSSSFRRKSVGPVWTNGARSCGYVERKVSLRGVVVTDARVTVSRSRGLAAAARGDGDVRSFECLLTVSCYHMQHSSVVSVSRRDLVDGRAYRQGGCTGVKLRDSGYIVVGQIR